MLDKLKHIFTSFNSQTNRVWRVFEIKNKSLKQLVKASVFLISITWFYSYIGVFKYIHNRPSSIHISAQCQRASIALNYYKADMNFFKPRIQRYIKGEGITGVEFPIIYYASAIMYKLFGFNEMYLRIISLILVTMGLFFFYLLMNQYLRNNLISVMLTIAASLSPVLLFYTPNFMPDAPSLGLQLAAWYFFLSYLKTNKTNYLNWFAVFGSMAALIKATSGMIFIIVVCLVILDKLKFFRSEKGAYIFTNHIKIVKRIIVGSLIVFAWYYYARWLSKHYEYESFALRTVTVDDWNMAKEIFGYIKNLWFKHYYAYESYVLISSAFIMMLLLVKFANRVLLSITVLNIIGYTFYVYFFFYQFKWHDYYIIAILPCIFFLLLTFGEMIVRFSDNYFKLLHIVFIVVLFFNMKEGLILCKKNYTERNTRAIYYWTGDYRAYEDLEPKLRAMGIKRTDKFLSAFDDTYCSSLYLIDQIGVNVGNESTPEQISGFMNSPVIKYLIVNDSARFNKLYPNDLAKQIVITHRGLIIYKLRD